MSKKTKKTQAKPKSEFLTRIATNLRNLRGEKSQKEIAEKVGISISYLSMLERGERSPALETIEILAKKGFKLADPAELLKKVA